MYSTSWEANSDLATQEIPRISLKPCSQQPATGPYPVPDEFSPHFPTLYP
jgi:hypothetical protein